jgi:predicted RNase H-like nuclease (RuvC/YqgF family)
MKRLEPGQSVSERIEELEAENDRLREELSLFENKTWPDTAQLHIEIAQLKDNVSQWKGRFEAERYSHERLTTRITWQRICRAIRRGDPNLWCSSPCQVCERVVAALKEDT